MTREEFENKVVIEVKDFARMASEKDIRKCMAENIEWVDEAREKIHMPEHRNHVDSIIATLSFNLGMMV